MGMTRGWWLGEGADRIGKFGREPLWIFVEFVEEDEPTSFSAAR